jgi:hypothetical protein
MFLVLLLAGFFVIVLFMNPVGEIIPPVVDWLPFLEGKSLFEFLYEHTSDIFVFLGLGTVIYIGYKWITN